MASWENVPITGSNPYGYEPMPPYMLDWIYGGPRSAPAASTPPPGNLGSGGFAGPGLNAGLPPGATPPPIQIGTPNQWEFPGGFVPAPEDPEIPAPPELPPIDDEVEPPPQPGETPPTPAPVAPPGAPRPAWTQNPPGSILSPRDRFLAGQDVDPRSGTGEPGSYNPLGPGGPPGTLGIVSPSSPAGGGSFFGGPTNLAMALPGSFYNIGGSGGNLGNYQSALFHGIWGGKHPYDYATWRANQAWHNYQGDPFGKGGKFGGIGGSYANYLNIWNSLRNAPPKAPVVAEFSGAAPGGAGRPPTKAYQSGGVVEDEPSDFYSRVGRPVYNAGRKIESTASDIFHGLGELGKYLKTNKPSMPIVQGTMGAIPKTPDGMLEWMLTPQRTPTPTPYPTPADGKGAVKRFFTDPDLSPRRMLDEMEPPPFGRPDGPPPYPWTRRFMPQLYDQRASGSELASTDRVPAMLTPGEVVLNERQQSAVMPIPGREYMLRGDQRAKLASKMWG